MEKYQGKATDTAGTIIPNATVTVKISGTETLATLYGDAAGEEPLDNPFAATVQGVIAFYVEDGRYDITWSAPYGYSDSFTDKQIFDGAGVFDASTAAAQAAAAAEAARDEAEVAADAAVLSAASIYPTTAAGLAAVAEGGYFYVPSGDAAQSLILYRDVAGVAVEQKRLPSSAQVVTNTTNIADVVARRDESETALSFPSASDYLISYTNISNPATRFTTSVNGSNRLVVNQNQASVLLVGFQRQINDLRGLMFEVEAVCTNVNVQTGLAIGLNSAYSTPLDNTNGIFWTWRANSGALVAYRGDGATAASAFEESPEDTATTFTDGDLLKMQMQFDADGETAVIRRYKNGVLVNSQRAPTVSNLPASYYIGAYQRGLQSGGLNSICEFYSFTHVYKTYRERAFYINGASGPGGNGTEANPFNNLTDAIASVDESPGRLSLLLKGGDFRGSIQLPGDKYREIRIAYERGSQGRIIGATQRTSGWVKTGGFTNVYERDHIYQGVLSGVGSGGVIDVTNPNVAKGLAYTQYTRLSPNTALATLDATPGAMVVNTTAKKLYVHALGSVDPNTLTLEVADQDFAVGIRKGGASSNHYCRVILENVYAKFAYSRCIELQQCWLDAVECIAEGSAVTDGFGLNDTSGRLFACQGLGNRNDGFNASGSIFTPDSKLLMIDCKGLRNVVGDGASNHRGSVWTIIGGEYSYNGKHGVVPAIDDCTCIGVEANYNTDSGFVNGGTTAPDTGYMRLRNCIAEYNTLDGAKNVTAFNDNDLDMDIEGGRYANNGAYGVRSIIQGVVTGTTVDTRLRGGVIGGGNAFADYVATGGATISVVPGTVMS